MRCKGDYQNDRICDLCSELNREKYEECYKIHIRIRELKAEKENGINLRKVDLSCYGEPYEEYNRGYYGNNN